MTWKCRICDTENDDDTEICVTCGAYKEEDYDAYADEMDEEEG